MPVFTGVGPVAEPSTSSKKNNYNLGGGGGAQSSTVRTLQEKLSKVRHYVPNLPHFNILPSLKSDYSKGQNFILKSGKRMEAQINGERQPRFPQQERPKSVRNALAVEEEQLRQKKEAEKQEALSTVEVKKPDGSAIRPKITNHMRYQQLVKYEGRNCRFYGVLYDTFTEAFEQRLFTIIYFLADDTLQVEEITPPNSGRACFFKTFFSRNKLPKEFQVGQIGHNLKYDEQECIGLEDLGVRKTIRILSTDFFLYDADEFTRKHYSEKLGVVLEPAVDISLKKPETRTVENNKKAGDKGKEQDLNIDLDGRVLQWSVKNESDPHRAFILLYYLYDNEIRINSVKASGYGALDSGCYVAKKKYTNPKTGKSFVPHDFVVGESFVIFNKSFTILGMNSFTRRYFEKDDAALEKGFLCDALSDDQLENTLQRLLLSLGKTSANLQKVFRSFDETKDHVLCFKDFKGLVYHYGFRLSEEDSSRLFHFFDSDNQCQLSFDQFVATVYEEDYPKNRTQRILNVPAFDNLYLAHCLAKVEQRHEVREIQRIMLRLSSMIHHRGSKTRGFLFNEFTPYIRSRDDNLVTPTQIHKVFGEVFGKGLFSQADVNRCLAHLYPTTWTDGVDYVQLLADLLDTHHDFARIRAIQ